MKLVEVMAGVITDARGRILLARRTEGRDLAGLWEFPGGKREPGETPEAALARELHEELGIEARIDGHLITVPQAYPTKRLRLDVRHVTHWTGIPRGREGQALAWVPPHRLASYAMPPADIPVVAALQQPDRYAISPDALLAPGSTPVQLPVPAPSPSRSSHGCGQEGPVADMAAPAALDRWLGGLEQLLAAGIRRIQIRLPSADAAQRRALTLAATERCRDAGADVLINGDLELARELGIGLHLRAAQLASVPARPDLAAGVLLAASCHDAAELAHATRLGCDFAVLGAVKPTATHPGEPGIGWEAFARLREDVSLPIYALGGLGPEDLEDARRHGAQGIAAIRSLWPH